MERKPKSPTEYDFQIAKGNEANLILNNQMLNDVLAKIESNAVARMIDSLDPLQRESEWHKVRAIRDLKAELQSIANSGKIAAKRKELK
ncbi:hypothetical protein [Burkholderia guangdongensis]|uniref:hypothetical protein n=1 Tax=Burkholderia guangdongensis TaxID=1792500 RepID=UPI0015CE33D6|nr:hypothetical protein [Burkholderia guangdongensis]